MTTTTIEIIPVTASADGKRNAFHHYCGATGQNKNFAVCCHLMQQRKEGRLGALYEDCSVAISKKKCPAIAMRKEEEAAGHAIYFKERIRAVGEAFMETAKTVIAAFAPKPAPVKTTEKKRKSSVIDSIDDKGYADAINATVAAKTEPTPPVTVTPVAGESLMEMAKRLMAQQKEAA